MSTAEDRNVLTALGKECLEECKDEEHPWEAAADLLGVRVLEDTDLFKQLLGPMLVEACFRVIQKIAHKGRVKYKDDALDKGSSREAGLRGLAKENLLNYQLSGGTKLGDATEEKLSAEIAICEHNVKGNYKTMRWFQMILADLQRKKVSCVKEAMGHKQLRAAFRRADTATQAAMEF